MIRGDSIFFGDYDPGLTTPPIAALWSPLLREEGSFWFTRWVGSSGRPPTPDPRLLTPDSRLLTPAKGGPLCGWGGWESRHQSASHPPIPCHESPCRAKPSPAAGSADSHAPASPMPSAGLPACEAPSAPRFYRSRGPIDSSHAREEGKKGLRTVTPRQENPSCKSSLSQVPHPASAATAHINASQIDH